MPRVIDYYIEQQLIEDGYTYCGYERSGSIRYTKRIWMLDSTCSGQLIEPSNIE